MTKQFNLSQVELELLEALLQPEDATYPWNPADENSEEYFLQLEEQFGLQDVLAEELTTRSHDFYDHLESLWNSHNNNYNHNTSRSLVAELQENLQTTLTTCVPKHWLQVIAQTATDVFDVKQSMADRLVACVQSVLPGWGAEDLMVLARPYAYAMRGNEPQDIATSTINQFGEREWTDLSDIEQARVSLAVAYYALQQLQNSEGES